MSSEGGLGNMHGVRAWGVMQEGAMAVGALSKKERESFAAAFPEVVQLGTEQAYGNPARVFAKKKELLYA